MVPSWPKRSKLPRSISNVRPRKNMWWISEEKWQRYGTCSISQRRRGPSNGVSKMNLFMAGGHSFWPRKLIFGYVVAQCIYPKSYYYSLLIKSSVWSRQGPKDVQSVPKYRVRLYTVKAIKTSWWAEIVERVTIKWNWTLKANWQKHGQKMSEVAVTHFNRGLLCLWKDVSSCFVQDRQKTFYCWRECEYSLSSSSVLCKSALSSYMPM